MRYSKLLRLAVLTGCSSGLFAEQAGGATPDFRALNPTATPRRVDARSGPFHTTWDLGPVAGDPAKHNFAVEISGAAPAPAVTWPGVLGDGPARFRFPGGEWVELRLSEGPRLPIREAPAAVGAESAPGAAHLQRTARTERLAFIAGERTLLRFAAGGGARLEWRPAAGGGEMAVRDARGLVIYRYEFRTPAIISEAAVGGLASEVELALAPQTPGGDAVLLSGVVNGTWGGRQCYEGSSTNGSAYDNYPTGLAYVGDLAPDAGDTIKRCRAFVMWPLSSTVPADATIQYVYLWNLVAANEYFTGSPMTQTLVVHGSDINFDTALPAGDLYDYNNYLDFGNMKAGAPEYFSLNNLLGDGTLQFNYTLLSGAALSDANARLRDPAHDYFAIGFRADAITDGNYMAIDSDASTLLVAYTDYTHNQVVMHKVSANGPIGGATEVRLYNFGEDIDVGGWVLSSTNYAGTIQSFTLPAGVTLKRHDEITIRNGTGASSYPTYYTGAANTFTWNGPAANDPLHLRLYSSGGANAQDYFCNATVAAPPASTDWDGACVDYDLFQSGMVLRARDADTDTASDWAQVNYSGGSDPTEFMVGTRRPSEVVINEVLLWGGFNWIELLNLGPQVDLMGWSIATYDGDGTSTGTYSFSTSAVMNTGDRMWLAEGSTYFNPETNLRRNTGLNLNFEVAPRGGQILLADDGGKSRDYLVFMSNDAGIDPTWSPPANQRWIGAPVRIGAQANPTLRRVSELSTLSAGDWFVDDYNTGSPTFGNLNPGQGVANRVQDSFGSFATSATRTVAAHGYGNRIQVERMVGLERIAIPAGIVSGGASNARIVVKRSGAAALLYDEVLSVPDGGTQTIVSSQINTPLVLLPGNTYAVMLYVNGEWYRFEGVAGDREYGSMFYPFLGGVTGNTFQSGFTPTTSMNTEATVVPMRMSLVTVPAPAVTNSTPLPDGELTVPYSFAHTSSGGYGATRSWAISAGALPPGLVMSAAGVVSGTPTQDGVFAFTVRVTDGAGLYGEQAETLTVHGRLAIATSALPYYDRMNAPYSFLLRAYGGLDPLLWGCTGLPTGLSCNAATGEISGTTSVANGAYTVNVTVSDANGLNAAKSLVLQVYYAPVILTAVLADGYVGQDYGVQKILAAGGTGAIVWSVSAGALPPGLSFNTATAEITGIPTAEGVYNFSITYDPTGGVTTQAYSIRVTQATVPDYWVRRGLAGGTVKDLYYSPQFASDRTVIASSGSSLYISQDGGYFWRHLSKFKPTPGATSGQIILPRVLGVIFDPSFDGRAGFGTKTVYAATTSAVESFLKSTDAGASWNRQPTSLATFQCGDSFFRIGSYGYCLGLDAAFGAYGPMTVYRALLSSATWTFSQRNATRQFDRMFAADNNHLYAHYRTGGETRLYRSTDLGVNWSDFGAIARPLSDLAFSPGFNTTHSLVYVSHGGGASTLQVSFDYGYSFTPRAGLYDLTEARFDPGFNGGSNQRIFASGRTGTGLQMMISSDAGVTFSPTGGGGMPGYKFSGAFRFSPQYASDSTVMALGANGAALFRSAAAGVAWGPSENGLYYQKINAVAVAPNFGTTQRAFAGTDASIYYTDDGGKIWRAARLNGSSANFRKIRAIGVAPNYASNGVVLALSCYANPADVIPQTVCQVMRSGDGGLTFTDTGAGGSFFGYSAFGSDVQGADDMLISPDYATTPRVFIKYPSSKGMYLYRSNDGGNNFTPVDDCYQNYSFTPSPGMTTDGTVYGACGFNGEANVRISTDFGATFIDMATVPFTGGFRPALAPSYNRASGTNGTASKTLLAAGQKSTDGGATFAPLDAESFGTPVFSPAYATDNTFFNYYLVNGNASGLYKTTDGGATMVPQTVVGDGSPFYDINQIAPAPNYVNGGANQTVFVATGAGLYQTNDGGTNWSLSTGTQSFSDQVTAAAQDPNRPGRLYMGSYNDGIVYSDDDGETTRDITLALKSGGVPYAVRSLLAIDNLATPAVGDTVLLVSTSNGLFRMPIDATGAPSGTWSLMVSTALGRRLSTDGTYCFLARASTVSYRSTVAGGCDATWATFTLNSEEINFTPMTGPTVPLTGATAKRAGALDGATLATGSADAYWSANLTLGAQHSPTGTGYVSAPGTNDYTLPNTSGYVSIQPMGINAQSSAREVALGHSTLGVFLTGDGGDTWRNVSGPGSGLEATSKNASTFLLTQTTYGTTDVLVGVNGSANGGVYLSGDGGSHWTQINQGYDPNTLSISTLAKSSCSGCPVQYYSGSYGGGLYTRTITVLPAPFYVTAATWCTGGGCTCGSGAFTGPAQGGTSFKLCGSNFQTGAVVEFDGVAATGCAVSGGTTPNFTVITCSTPPHAAGNAVVRVRNPDTRARQLAQPFTFTNDAGDRIGNTLLNSKSGVNANLSWYCSLAGCPSNNPMRLYRAQTPAMSLYLENYNAGQGGTMTGGCANAGTNNSCYMDATGIMSNTRSYFWVVE